MDLRSSTFIFILYLHNFIFVFQVCCLGTQCSNDTLWVPATVSSKSGLTITLNIDQSCSGKPLYSLRYLWRETPCPFKQAAIYSGTDPNLPSPPYVTLFTNT